MGLVNAFSPTFLLFFDITFFLNFLRVLFCFLIGFMVRLRAMIRVGVTIMTNRTKIRVGIRVMPQSGIKVRVRD